eukprot:TRINITY_DN4086_c0_g1_i3.p1 TRINITY_DN4086_c0_g1~~TRINITY_DN4086_c0_g1_i3.p1  ORF type:complete len:287 (-),score=66.72 TRINITY_DN4086_c0_g1_i3:94-954(-)
MCIRDSPKTHKNIPTIMVEMCKAHNMALSLYCVEDKNKICLKCLREHTKQKHEVILMEDYIKEYINPKLSGLKEIMKEKAASIDSTEKTLLNDAKEIIKETATLKEKLRNILKKVENLEKDLPAFPETPDKTLSKDIDQSLSIIEKEINNSTKGEECEKKILYIEEKINGLLKNISTYDALKAKFYDIIKRFEDDNFLDDMAKVFQSNFLIDFFSPWTLYAIYRGTYVTFSNNNMTVENSSGGQASIIGLSLIHISEPTRPLYISYAVFCLKKKKKKKPTQPLREI